MTSAPVRAVAGVLTGAVALAIAACAPPTSGLSARNGRVDDGGPLDLTMWTNLTVNKQAEVIRRQAEQCAADQQGVTVTLEAVPFDSMYPKMVTSFRSGNGPDIMNTIEGGVATAEAGGFIVPVDDVIDEHGRDDFLASHLHAMSKDGSTWAVPDWALHQEVWYRKDLFQAKGLNPPATWAELLEVAKKVDDPEHGIRGFAVPMGSALVAPQMYFQFLYSAGVTVFDPKTGAYALDRDRQQAIDATAMMLDLYKAASPPESRTWSWNDFRNAYADGQVAMTLDFGAVVGIAAEQNPKMLDKMGVFAMPAPTADATNRASLGGGYFYMIGRSYDRREQAAKKVVSCLMQPESVAARTNTRPVFALPATTSATKTPTFRDNTTVKQFAPEISTIRTDVLPRWYRYGMESGLNPLAGQIESTTFVGDILQDAAAGNRTPAEAFDAIDTEMKRLAGVS